MILQLKWQNILLCLWQNRHNASDAQSLFFNSCAVKPYANCLCRALEYYYYMFLRNLNNELIQVLYKIEIERIDKTEGFSILVHYIE